MNNNFSNIKFQILFLAEIWRTKSSLSLAHDTILCCIERMFIKWWNAASWFV